jgi:glycosyltransferase involved in cell wall biosynthesis
LKILRVADVRGNRSGGMSRTMFCTGDELVRRGHSVDYFWEDRFQHRLPPQLWRFSTPIQLWSKIRSALRAGAGWDVVEIHEPISLICTLLFRHSPRVVLFSYGLEERSHQSLLDYRTRKGLPISVKMRWSPRTVTLQSRIATRRAHHVICSNSEDVSFLRARGVPESHLTRHHSGVDPIFLNTQPRPWSERRGILFLGGWLERKGILDLIPAVTELLKRHPDEFLTVAGCHASAETVKGLFDPAVQERVHVIPRIEGDAALVDIYARHRIFVLPSYFEGQPLVMIEAASQGMAIVTTGVCGMLDFIRPEENGLLVPVADPPALNRALERLVTHPDEAARMGAKARESAMTHTGEAAATKIEKAYRQALAL